MHKDNRDIRVKFSETYLKKYQEHKQEDELKDDQLKNFQQYLFDRASDCKTQKQDFEKLYKKVCLPFSSYISIVLLAMKNNNIIFLEDFLEHFYQSTIKVDDVVEKLRIRLFHSALCIAIYDYLEKNNHKVSWKIIDTISTFPYIVRENDEDEVENFY